MISRGALDERRDRSMLFGMLGGPRVSLEVQVLGGPLVLRRPLGILGAPFLSLLGPWAPLGTLGVALGVLAGRFWKSLWDLWGPSSG